jgi:hypothetical protein
MGCVFKDADCLEPGHLLFSHQGKNEPASICHAWNIASCIPGPASPNRFFADSIVFQWQNQTLRADLILIFPVGLGLGIGIAIGHPAAGMIAAGGALTSSPP